MNESNDKKHRVWGCLKAAVALLLIVAGVWGYTHPQDEQLVKESIPKIPSVKEITKGKEDKGRQIDFKALQKENPDIVAWIEVPGTDIDYPVMQSSEDEEEDYYLHHDFDRNYSSHGSIYIQKRNKKDFTSFNTILYGHNMNDGSMFKQLHRFEDEEFFAKHKKIRIYLPDKTLTYRTFAAYYGSDRLILDDWEDYENPPDRQKCINFIRTSEGNQREKVKVTAKDKLITLSTCTSSSSCRLLVVGKLKKTQSRR